ncbi:hypothetical protein HDU97_003016 [Phlyctochytrium planicorne]|nr:hypothetical protein HDU97_003016 [Phlyctochytrium planicorne]
MLSSSSGGMWAIVVLMASAWLSVANAQGQPKIPTETYPIKMVSLTVSSSGISGELWVYQKQNMVAFSTYYVYAKIMSKDYKEVASTEASPRGSVPNFPNIASLTFSFPYYDPKDYRTYALISMTSANAKRFFGIDAEYIPDHNQQTDNILGEFRDQGPNYDLVSFAPSGVPDPSPSTSQSQTTSAAPSAASSSNPSAVPSQTIKPSSNTSISPGANNSTTNNLNDPNSSDSIDGSGPNAASSGSNLLVILAIICTFVVLLIVFTLGFACYRRRQAERSEMLYTLPWKKRASLSGSRGGVMARTERRTPPGTPTVRSLSALSSSSIHGSMNPGMSGLAMPPVNQGKLLVEGGTSIIGTLARTELPPVVGVASSEVGTLGTMSTGKFGGSLVDGSVGSVVNSTLGAPTLNGLRRMESQSKSVNGSMLPVMTMTTSANSRSSVANSDKMIPESTTLLSKSMDLSPVASNPSTDNVKEKSPLAPSLKSSKSTSTPSKKRSPIPSPAVPLPTTSSSYQQSYAPATSQSYSPYDMYDAAAAAAYQQQWYAAAAAAQQQQQQQQQQQWMFAQGQGAGAWDPNAAAGQGYDWMQNQQSQQQGQQGQTGGYYGQQNQGGYQLNPMNYGGGL